MLQSLAFCLLNPCITPCLFILELELEEVYLPMVYQGDNTQVTKAIDKSILDPTDADDNNGRKGNANYPAVTKIQPLLDSQPPTYSTLSYTPTNNGI